MQLHAWGAFRNTSSWRPLAGFLLIVAVLGCFFAPHSFAQPHSVVAPVAVASAQSVGIDAAAASPAKTQIITQVSASTTILQSSSSASILPASTPVSTCDSLCSAGNNIAGVACLVLAIFGLLWLIRLPVVDVLGPRRLATRGNLIRFFTVPLRAPSLLVLSISRI